MFDPETGQPFVLLDAERQFLAHAFQTDDSGRLRYSEQVFGAPKKSGKTGFAALHMLTTILLFGTPFAEGYALANDLEQATSRVFQAIKRIVECSPLLRREAKITADKITFPAFAGATITAIASDYAGAAGANPVISSFDELWGFTSERSHRLWDEMIPPPTRKIACRLTTTYAGFSGESVLLEALYKRGMAQPQLAPNLYAGDGLLMAWHHEPIAPWQTEAWLAEMRRSLRPNQYLRMIENRFVTSESSFVDLSKWDACVDPNMTPTLTDKALPIWVGVDACVKHDSTAIVACNWDQKAQRVRLIWHRVFQPSPDEPLDFEATIETTLLDLQKRFQVRKVLFDPWQMQAVAQRLTRQGLTIEEFPQSPGNLTIASQNLVRADRGPQFGALSRRRDASCGFARGRHRDIARLAHREGKAEPQDRRRRCFGAGRTCVREERDRVDLRSFDVMGDGPEERGRAQATRQRPAAWLVRRQRHQTLWRAVSPDRALSVCAVSFLRENSKRQRVRTEVSNSKGGWTESERRWSGSSPLGKSMAYKGSRGR